MLTIRQINGHLKYSQGLVGCLHRAKDYFYFAGPSFEMSPETGVYGVRTLNSLSLAQWMLEAHRVADAAKLNSSL